MLSRRTGNEKGGHLYRGRIRADFGAKRREHACDFVFEQSSNRRSFERHEARITKRSVAVVALVTLAAGVAGFATVEKSFEEVQARTLVVRAYGLRASSRCDGSGGAAASPAAVPLSAAEPGGGCEPCDLRTSSSRRPMERRSSVTT